MVLEMQSSYSDYEDYSYALKNSSGWVEVSDEEYKLLLNNIGVVGHGFLVVRRTPPTQVPVLINSIRNRLKEIEHDRKRRDRERAAAAQAREAKTLENKRKKLEKLKAELGVS